MGNTIKTAVSLDRELLERTQALAGAMHTSRSRVMALALEDFVQREESRLMLEQINSAYEEPEDKSERNARKRMRRLQKALVNGEW